MRYIINQIQTGEDELILNYREMNEEIENIMSFMGQGRKKLQGKCDGEVIVFAPEEILYVEKVDEKTFVYTMNRVIQVDLPLYSLERFLDDIHFFRCSKSMIVNVNKVEKLKSLSSNRIDTTLVNGEHILISRTYATEFRKLLKGDRT